MERPALPSWLMPTNDWKPPVRIVHPKGNRPRIEAREIALKYRVTCLVKRGWSVERIAQHLDYSVPYVERLIKCVVFPA